MPTKAKIKTLIGKAASIDWLEKLTEYAIAAQDPSVSLAHAETILPTGTSWQDVIDRGRETLWTRTLERVPRDDLLLLEFGVWRGDSIRFFAGHNRSPKSVFYGFDSFEGLPENWRGMEHERFDVGGAIPRIDDARVRFVKGWFRDTLPSLLDELAEASQGRELLVHYDADLYSSTLYLLFTLGTRFKRYRFIFDEYSGHETRALYNYAQATGAKCRFFYRLDWQGCAQVVSGEIEIP
jgi:hypothetical protein